MFDIHFDSVKFNKESFMIPIYDLLFNSLCDSCYDMVKEI